MAESTNSSVCCAKDRRSYESTVDDEPPLKVKRTCETACLPARASAGAAGYDLCASESGSIAPGTRKVVKTGLELAIPPGCYGRIAPRSGLSIRNGIDVAAGVLDPDYRGPVGIVLQNNGSEPFHYEAKQRVAQLILERIRIAPVVEVDELDETQRGANGFGSTGLMDTARYEAKEEDKDAASETK